jgi:predicted Ser/Thr protein kinase
MMPDPPESDRTPLDATLTLSGSGQRLAAGQGLPEGFKLGKYELEGELGRGGMGVVYAARDTALDRPVAVKVLPPTLTDDPTARQRFVLEARLAARLQHPNVVSIYDVGRQGGTHFIAMERVSGRSLEAVLREDGPLPATEASRVAAEACRALVAAHAAGLVHRDIKPGNILLTDDGRVKVTDFGLAKLHGQAQHQSLSGGQSLLGTPLYMSPEQCEQGQVDPRTDLYALGATYYHLLTGRPPFEGESVMQLLYAHCHTPAPDPSEDIESLPAICGRVVQRSMAKLKDERYASAKAMLADLDAAAGVTSGIAAASGGLAAALDALGDTQAGPMPAADTVTLPDFRAASPRRKRRAGTGVSAGGWIGGAAAAVALVIGGGMIWPSDNPQSAMASTQSPATTSSNSTSANAPRAASVSPMRPPASVAITSDRQSEGEAGAPTDPETAPRPTDPKTQAAGVSVAASDPPIDASAEAAVDPLDASPTTADIESSPVEPVNVEAAATPEPTTPTEPLDHATQQFHKLRDDFAEARAEGERYAIERGVRLLQVFARRYERSTDAAERKLAVQAYRLIEEAAPQEVEPSRPHRRGNGPRPPRR